MRFASTATSAGARAGAATNSRVAFLDWVVEEKDEHETNTHPTSFLANHRKGFSKL